MAATLVDCKALLPPQLPQLQDLFSTLLTGREKSLISALRIYSRVVANGLDAYPLLGNFLMKMFVDVGSMYHAQLVFNRLLVREEVSWNSLLSGYIEHGSPYLALSLYHRMQENCSLHLNELTFVPLLKACIRTNDPETGQSIHSLILKDGLLGKNIFIGGCLIDMYGKCGFLSRAQEVFDQLPVRDIVSWTALIGGYSEHGSAEEALKYFECMELEGVYADSATLVCCLQASNNIGATAKAEELHIRIVKTGSESNHVLNSALVDTYVKLGMLTEAQAVFDKLEFQDVVSWTSLLAGYAEHGQGHRALEHHVRMQYDGISPTNVTYVCTLKACGSTRNITKGQELHIEIIQKGFLENVFVGSALIDMYVKCGSFESAEAVFHKHPIRNVVFWNALISGYIENGYHEDALEHFEGMQCEGMSPDLVTFVGALKACGSIRDMHKGQKIHADVIRKGLEGDTVVGNSLIDMFSKCNRLIEARDVFDKLSTKNMVSWTTLVAGYAEFGYAEELEYLMNHMHHDGISFNSATLVCSLKLLGTFEKAQETHSEIVKLGFERELLVGNSLVNMYAKCSSLSEAEDVFQSLIDRDVVSWNSMMTGFVEHGYFDETLNCLEMMQNECICPDGISFVYSLKACCGKSDIGKSREIHSMITKISLPEMHDTFGSTLIDMYSQCGSHEEARKVFDELGLHSISSWNALMMAYAEHGNIEEAVDCFTKMQEHGVSPDSVSVVSALKACSSLEIAAKGQQIHSSVMMKGLDTEPLVVNALVFMYAKCSLIMSAQEVFDSLSEKNNISWTSLMAGYAQLGQDENVFWIFDKMIESGVKPDIVTFGSVLSACSHAGLVDKGKRYFDSIVKDHHLVPTLEHYVCMIDLLARAGHVADATAMIKRMPYHPGNIVWHILLGACRKWANVEIGRYAFEQALKSDENDISAYLCMYNIYQDAGMLEEARKIEEMRQANHEPSAGRNQEAIYLQVQEEDARNVYAIK